MVLDGFERWVEELVNHETLRELVFEEIVALTCQEGAELLYFEGGVVEDTDAELKLFLTIHNNLFILIA